MSLRHVQPLHQRQAGKGGQAGHIERTLRLPIHPVLAPGDQPSAVDPAEAVHIDAGMVGADVGIVDEIGSRCGLVWASRNDPAGGEVMAHEAGAPRAEERSEEHTSELQSLMRISYAVFCLKKKS